MEHTDELSSKHGEAWQTYAADGVEDGVWKQTLTQPVVALSSDEASP